MAEIVFGVGCSHSPMLGIEPEDWDQRGKEDMQNPAHPFRGGVYTYDELLAVRKDENLAAEHTMDKRRERYKRTQEKTDLLGEKITEAKLDVLVVIGDDQRECFMPDFSPAFVIYNGEKVINRVLPAARLDAMPLAIQKSAYTKYPTEGDVIHEGEPDLANHIAQSMTSAEIDITVCDDMPPGRFGENGIPHAYGFFYRRILNDFKDNPGMSTLPIFINDFFPPNQPTAKRVWKFGEVLGDAIRSWDSPKRIGIAASGGFSHFVVDEDLDWRILKAMEAGDKATIVNEPEHSYQSGTSEIKNWIATQSAVLGSGLSFKLIDYIPCYRTDAGTGNGNTFGVWG